MKNISALKLTLLSFCLMLFIQVSAQDEANKKIAKVEIKTSAVCEMCKNKIEKNLIFEKGVKSVVLDVDTKIATVEYKVGKTDVDKIRKAITKLGYDADEVKAEEEALEKLHPCCKPGAH